MCEVLRAAQFLRSWTLLPAYSCQRCTIQKQWEKYKWTVQRSRCLTCMQAYFISTGAGDGLKLKLWTQVPPFKFGVREEGVCFPGPGWKWLKALQNSWSHETFTIQDSQNVIGLGPLMRFQLFKVEQFRQILALWNMDLKKPKPLNLLWIWIWFPPHLFSSLLLVAT